MLGHLALHACSEVAVSLISNPASPLLLRMSVPQNGTTTNHHALQSAIFKFSHQNYGGCGPPRKSDKFTQKAALKISRGRDLLTRRKCKAQEHGHPAFRTGLSYQRVESANQIQRAFIYSCGGCGRSGLYLQWRFLAVGLMMLVVGSLGCGFGCFYQIQRAFPYS